MLPTSNSSLAFQGASVLQSPYLFWGDFFCFLKGRANNASPMPRPGEKVKTPLKLRFEGRLDTVLLAVVCNLVIDLELARTRDKPAREQRAMVPG